RHYPLHLGQKRCPPRRLGVALKSRGRQRQLLHPPTLRANPHRRHYTTITAAAFCRGSLASGSVPGSIWSLGSTRLLIITITPVSTSQARTARSGSTRRCGTS